MSSTTRGMRLTPEQLRRNGRKYLSIADDNHDTQELFTTSLPSDIMASALASKRASMPQTVFQRSFTLSPSSHAHRARSSSVQHAGNALKRSLRLPRGRPNSAHSGTRRGSLRLPSLHRSKSNDEPAPTPESLDSAFEKIKLQLAQLSEEDHSLNVRMEKLSEEINALYKAHCSPVARPRSRTQKKSQSSEKLASFAASQLTNSTVLLPTLMVSSTSDNQLAVPTETAWTSRFPAEEGEVHLKGRTPEVTRPLSCSSFSDGSSYGEGLSQSQTCLLVIEDHSLSPSYNEDDVFFSLS